jgi:hypothetical protein
VHFFQFFLIVFSILDMHFPCFSIQRCRTDLKLKAGSTPLKGVALVMIYKSHLASIVKDIYQYQLVVWPDWNAAVCAFGRLGVFEVSPTRLCLPWRSTVLKPARCAGKGENFACARNAAGTLATQ